MKMGLENSCLSRNLEMDIEWQTRIHKAALNFRFYVLRSLNLADNDLQSFPMALCKMKLLTELNLASNKLEEVPADIRELEK